MGVYRYDGYFWGSDDIPRFWTTQATGMTTVAVLQQQLRTCYVCTSRYRIIYGVFDVFLVIDAPVSSLPHRSTTTKVIADHRRYNRHPVSTTRNNKLKEPPCAIFMLSAVLVARYCCRLDGSKGSFSSTWTTAPSPRAARGAATVLSKIYQQGTLACIY